MAFIKEWGMIAGLAGLALGSFLILFREVIRKNVFSKLTRKQSYSIIILFMLLVWTLSLFSIFRDSTFGEKSAQLTVYVHGPKGKQDVILENAGRLIVDFGNDRRSPAIGQNGRTNLGEIPKKFLNKAIEIGLDAPGYELADPARLYSMDGAPVYLAVKKDGRLGRISGIVKNQDGSLLLSDVLITINSDTMVTTNASGVFDVKIPGQMQIKDDSDFYLLSVSKKGYLPRTVYYYPRSGNIEIRLSPK